MSPLKIAVILVGLACTASAQNAAVTATATVPTGMIGNTLRAPIDSMRGAANGMFGLKSNALNFSLAAANQLTSGMIGAKQSMVNMGAGLKSSGLQFGTTSAANGAQILAGMAAPIPGLNTAANVGSRMFGAATSGANAVGQTAIATGLAAETAKLNAIKTGVQSATGMIGSIGNSVIDAEKSAANMGFDMALKGADMVSQAVDSGIDALNSAASSVNGMADSFASMANNAAAQAQATIPGTIPSRVSGSVAVSG